MKHDESDVERQTSIQCIHLSDFGIIFGKREGSFNIAFVSILTHLAVCDCDPVHVLVQAGVPSDESGTYFLWNVYFFCVSLGWYGWGGWGHLCPRFQALYHFLLENFYLCFALESETAQSILSMASATASLA